MSRPRRKPVQRRAHDTITAVLDAVARVLQRDGLEAITTNHIARAAGVSVGSVYQYFPDKHAIFRALHDRHAAEVARAIDAALETDDASLDARITTIFDALVDAHRDDPRLYALLSSDVPYRARGAEDRLRNALRIVLAGHVPARELDRRVFVLAPMIDALAHAIVLDRPSKLSRTAARDAALAALRAYLTASC